MYTQIIYTFFWSTCIFTASLEIYVLHFKIVFFSALALLI